MTRSRKKVPIIGMTTAESDKEYKTREHRRERRRVKVAVSSGEDVPDKREFGSAWNSAKDGKQYYPSETSFRK